MTEHLGLAVAPARPGDGQHARRELNHRIANSLQLAADLLMFEQLRSQDPNARAALEASRARLLAVGEVHRHLEAQGELAQVRLRPFMEGLGRCISASTGLACTTSCDDGFVAGDLAQQLGIALNECAINAAKHAYHGRSNGAFALEARLEGATLTVTARDEGDGDTQPPPRPGLGSSIIAAIARGLGAQVSVRDHHGRQVTFQVPLPAAAPRRFDL